MPKHAKSRRIEAASGPTFGELVEARGLVAKASTATRQMIATTIAQADQLGQSLLRVVSCHTCTAPKRCCSYTTEAFLYEAVPIAGRLVREGRDTPALRAQLRASAEAMENTPRDAYRRPCVFLSSNERCTIYEDRPGECGTCLVYSPALACSDPATETIEKFSAPLQLDIPPTLEEAFRLDLGLPREPHLYVGTLPRMVLLCLQAWSRRDFVHFFGRHSQAAADGIASAMGQ